MKKLTYLVSAIVAAFSATAHAEVSVSGSANVAYVNDVQGNAIGANGSTLDFSLSTTTANGIGISTGLSITVDQDAESAAGAGGGQAVTFTTGGATIVVGDIELGDTPGSVGGVVGNAAGDVGGFDSDVHTGFADDDGYGLSLSTAVGSATVSIGYILEDDGNSRADIDAAAAQTMSGINISMPLGSYTVSAGIADHSSGEQASGASVSGSMGGGTLTVGYSTQSLIATSDGTAADLAVAGDSVVMGATYAMALDADTTVSVGYQNAKDADSHSHTRTDLSLSRSLGGGASVFLDMRSLSGDTDANGDGTAMSFGTAVAF
jgi:hypothetical protein